MDNEPEVFGCGMATRPANLCPTESMDHPQHIHVKKLDN
jgi:hypothetical protein